MSRELRAALLNKAQDWRDRVKHAGSPEEASVYPVLAEEIEALAAAEDAPTLEERHATGLQWAEDNPEDAAELIENLPNVLAEDAPPAATLTMEQVKDIHRILMGFGGTGASYEQITKEINVNVLAAQPQAPQEQTDAPVVINAKFIHKADGWSHVAVEHNGERYDFVVPTDCVLPATAKPKEPGR